MEIKNIRLELGLSQQKFADYIGIPVANIQRWEQGIVNPPAYVLALIKRVIDLECQMQKG